MEYQHENTMKHKLKLLEINAETKSLIDNNVIQIIYFVFSVLLTVITQINPQKVGECVETETKLLLT